MLERKITTKVPASIWGHGALVVSSLAATLADARAEGAAVTGITVSQYDIGAMCLYQATTSVLLAQNPRAPLEDIAPDIIQRQAVTIDTTDKTIRPMLAKLDPSVRGPIQTAILASNHAVRLAMRTSRPTGELLPPSAPQIPTEEALAAFGGGVVPAVATGVLILAGVVGVAAIGGATYFATESKRVKAGLEAHVAELTSQTEAYKAQVAAAVQTGQEIPKAPMMVQKAAEAEASRWWWLAGGAAALAGAVALGYALRPKVERYTATVTETKRLPAPRRKNPARRRRRKVTVRKKSTPKKRTARKVKTRRKTRPNPKRTTKRTAKKKATPKKRTAKRTTKRTAKKKATPKKRTRRPRPSRARRHWSRRGKGRTRRGG